MLVYANQILMDVIKSVEVEIQFKDQIDLISWKNDTSTKKSYNETNEQIIYYLPSVYHKKTSS